MSERKNTSSKSKKSPQSATIAKIEPKLTAKKPERVPIVLAMMVKNEVGSIAKTISSCRNAVTHVYILDTGSTDGTQQVARAAAERTGLKLTIESAPFVDFSTTRNLCLENAEKIAPLVLMLSGDERVVDDSELAQRAWSLLDDPDKPGCWYLRVELGDTTFDSARLFRSEAHLRYVGPVHEYVEARDWPIGHFHGSRIVHDLSTRDSSRAMARFERDLDLLLAEVAKPGCAPRWKFYLAQTYECLGRPAEAIPHYAEVVRETSWHEEKYEAAFRAARCMRATNASPERVLRAFEYAHELSPHRAEPLYELAQCYRALDRWSQALLYATSAWARRMPLRDKLFVDATIYSWRAAELVGIVAWYAGDFETGLRAAREAAFKHPELDHLLRNVRLYETHFGQADKNKR